jgi:hypothetical protein
MRVASYPSPQPAYRRGGQPAPTRSSSVRDCPLPVGQSRLVRLVHMAVRAGWQYVSP